MSAPGPTLNGHRPTAALTLPSGGQRRRLPLAGQRRPVAVARAFVQTALDDWSWPDQGDIVLLVAELVANTLLHADGPLELVLDATGQRLRIEVSDGSPVLPVAREPHLPARPGGHGLHIIACTSDRWGAALQSWGKTVWAEIDAPAPPRP
ncbi:ATP-binding protein [Kitasatospora sp. NPDC059973]|uniref:ATP-binding protein n=1 Tax=Kitasatospora sp. NPDC059973 TaxID=3347020 RepID=UPI0036809B2C